MTEIVRVRCPHRIGLCYRDGDLLRLLPCDCNDPSEVLEVVAVVPPAQPPTQTPAAKCDYCDQRATTLAGDTNGVLVCEDHVRLFAEREIAATIDAAQHPAAPETDVSALWALSTPSLWESPDGRSIPTLLAAIGQVLQRPSADLIAARERVRVVEGERDAAMAEERERIAQAIEAERDLDPRTPFGLGLASAAQIAREAR